jgi:hypothetical protein
MMIMLAIMPAGGWADYDSDGLEGRNPEFRATQVLESLIRRAVRLALPSHTVILSLLSETIQPVHAVLLVQKIFSPSTIENCIYESAD